MDFVGLALDIVGIAKTIHDAVEHVREFKTRSSRLSDRIQCLLPALTVLTEMKDNKRQKIIELLNRDPPAVQMPIFGQALIELRQVVQKVNEFIISFQKKNFGRRLWKTKSISGQFDSFSERLDVLQSTVQFGIVVEMRGLMEQLLGEERNKAAVNSVMTDIKTKLEKGKNGFRDRQDIDLEDDAVDIKELIEGQKKTSAGIEGTEQKLQQMAIASQKSSVKSSVAGFHVDSLKYIKSNELDIKEEIGKGSMGVVYKAFYNRHPVAVKRLDVHPLRGKLITDIQKAMKKEAEYLKMFDSKNVVRLWGICTEGPDASLMIVMEYMKRGTVQKVMRYLNEKEGTTNINWVRRVHMALGGALGLYRIHNMHPPMLHCAIDSAKFLVDKDFEVKISDVGFVHTRSSTGREHVSRAISYYAPEHIMSPRQRYDERSEMYSFGVVMWEIVSGQQPYADWMDGCLKEQQVFASLVCRSEEFRSDDQKKQYLQEKIEIDKVPTVDNLPTGFKTIIDRCRNHDRMLRPLASEVVDKLQDIEEALDDLDASDSE